MKTNLTQYTSCLLLLIFSFSCEDPKATFAPVNPGLTEEAVLGAPNSAKRLLAACERQLALCMNELVPLAEIASDNYQNTQTFYNQFVDQLEIKATDADINAIQFEIARLREMALSGIHEIGPADSRYSENQHAEFFFFVGIAYLLGAENFKSLPSQVGGVVVPASRHYELAAENFRLGAETTIDDDFIKVSCLLGRSRAQYALNQKEGAKAAAIESILVVPDFIRFARFDVVNGVGNAMQDAIADRGSFDDLQPLPRLDFLDPKYNQNDPAMDVDIPLLKIEEAYLILAEAAIAEGLLSEANDYMQNVIDVAHSRGINTYDDSTEDRTQNIPGSRPDNAAIRVASSSGSLLRTGLVLERKNELVEIPRVSGTSITEDMLGEVVDENSAMALLYLLRQEIFIAEGRRMSDLGVKLVVSELEQTTNVHVSANDLLVDLPPFISTIQMELDAFTYDPISKQVVVTHDLNSIIAINRNSQYVCPFH